MWPVIRTIISVFLSVEMLFTGLGSGFPFKKIEMPEMPESTFGKYVDPFIGTGGTPWAAGMLSPAATVPFGNVRLGPDTSAIGGIYLFKTNTSGYYYEHGHIKGFSYGRLSGTGIMDYGMFRVTPACGKSEKKIPTAMAYSHKNEEAAPGYYAVYLPAASSLCEMTATEHSGYQRYTFDTSKNAQLFIDAASSLGDGSVENEEIGYNAENGTITGEVTMFGGFSGRSEGLKVYYYAETDTKADVKPLESGTGLVLNFGNIKGKPVTLRAGISYVSAENAKENLYAEAAEMTFDEVKNTAAAKWDEKLSKISINADAKTKTVFYTSLYHSMIMPSDYTDYNGEYIGFDKQKHTADGFTYRSDMSLWDTARNVHSLYSLIEADIQQDCLESLLLMADQGGVLPRWPMGEGYTGSMFGNPADIIFAESYLKGFDFDMEKAFEYMKKSSETTDNKENREWADLFIEYGYLPDDIIKNESRSLSVSRTLEYSWDDYAVSVIASALGKEEDAEIYAARSMNYKNVWNPETKYFQPKNSDGSWGTLKPNMTTFYDDIFGFKYSKPYCEGSPRHWRWGVLHDIDGVIELFGSKEYFAGELEDFMKDASLNKAAINPGAGFWIGNQHDIHTPYLFNNADRADLTQKWVRWTLSERFGTEVNGLDGNDDGGTLSSWYVFSSLGFYPIAGTDRYWIGSPAVDSAEMKLSNGSTLKVTVNNQGEKNIYVSSVTFNGEKLDSTEFNHSMIKNGGEFVFNMTDKPVK